MKTRECVRWIWYSRWKPTLFFYMVTNTTINWK